MGCNQRQGAPNGWNPNPWNWSDTPDRRRQLEIQAGKLDPQLRTNRGRWVHSSSKWAGPSCRPDVGSWTTGDLSSTLATADRWARGEGRRDGRGQRWWQNTRRRCPAGSRTALHCGVEVREPLAQRGRRFPIPRKVRYRLSAALGLAQHNRAGYTGRDIGPGETHAIVCGGKETWP